MKYKNMNYITDALNDSNFSNCSEPTPLGKDDTSLAVKWESVKSTTPYQIPYLDITARLELRNNPEPERMEFWDDIYQQYNGDFM